MAQIISIDADDSFEPAGPSTSQENDVDKGVLRALVAKNRRHRAQVARVVEIYNAMAAQKAQLEAEVGALKAQLQRRADEHRGAQPPAVDPNTAYLRQMEHELGQKRAQEQQAKARYDELVKAQSKAKRDLVEEQRKRVRLQRELARREARDAEEGSRELALLRVCRRAGCLLRAFAGRNWAGARPPRLQGVASGLSLQLLGLSQPARRYPALDCRPAPVLTRTCRVRRALTAREEAPTPLTRPTAPSASMRPALRAPIEPWVLGRERELMRLREPCCGAVRGGEPVLRPSAGADACAKTPPASAAHPQRDQQRSVYGEAPPRESRRRTI